MKLNNNQFSGSIPNELCDIDYLLLSYNNFCIPYPDCLTEQEIGYQDTSECIECIYGDLNYDSILDILDIVSTVNCILLDNCIGCSDFNGDGLANILDIVALVNIVIDSSNLTSEQSCAADLNEDGVINILDIVGLVNVVISG